MLEVKPLPPSPMQIKVLEAYTRLGSQKRVAHELNIAEQTVKNHLSNLYVRLEVRGVLEALTAMGWVKTPQTGVRPCGWIAYCGRPEDHRGQHGGFRPFVSPHQDNETNSIK